MRCEASVLHFRKLLQSNKTMERRMPAQPHDDLNKSVESIGFTKTLGERFADLVNAHSSGAGNYLGHDLAELLRRDPSTAAHANDDQSAVFQAQEATHKGFVNQIRARLVEAKSSIPGVNERDGTPVKVLIDEAFENWGRTVKYLPSVTAIPRSKVGVCNLVKWARSVNKRVRVSGYRHTWGRLYATDGEVIISTLPLDQVNDLPAGEPGIDPSNELQGIEIVGTILENGAEKALCKIGAGTTNEQFRRWCLNAEGGALEWTVPLNVLMVEMTWGGTNGPICHGAGLRHQTLSDLVVEVEFVNAIGQLQTVKDADHLKAAAGAFGLLGVVTSITLKLDRMTYAAMQPVKKRVALTIPPPDAYNVPSGVDMSGVTGSDLKSAYDDFVARAENSYYAEWFWFTFEPECWINTWHNDGDPASSSDYPGPMSSWIEEAEDYLAGLVSESALYNSLPETLQAEILAKGAMSLMPTDQTIVMPVIDALHFRRGIQNMRVFDMEWEIPIPGRADDPTEPDWSVCQRAWWDAISEVYAWKASGKAPMRLTLEMRIMGGSDTILAPQFGNQHGTCSIEVLTTINTDRADWAKFMQNMTDRWLAITDAKGGTLNTRPHWAKEWQGLTVRGQPINTYLRDFAYKDRIQEFGATLRRIAAAGGYDMAELKSRFSNDSLSDILGSIYDSAHPI